MKNYPEILLWNNGIKTPLERITTINPGDFDITGTIRGMGCIPSNLWDSLGIYDPKETAERNYIMRVLYSNPDFRERLCSLWAGNGKLRIPASEDSFLYFYQAKENPYWSAVSYVINSLRAINVTGKLAQFCEVLEEDLSLVQKEAKLADEVAEKLKNVAIMEGVFSIPVFLDEAGAVSPGQVVGKYIHGYKLFNSSYASEYKADIPKWIKWGFLRKRVQKIANKAKSEAAKRSSVITSYSSNLLSDLRKGFVSSILPRFVPKFGVRDSDITFTLYFSYSAKGLFIVPLSVATPGAKRAINWNLSDSLPNTSAKQKKFLEKKRKKLNEAMQEAGLRVSSSALYSCFPPNFFGKSFQVSSKGADSDYRWFAIGHIYRHNSFKNIFSELVGQRNFFFNMLSQINSLSLVLSNFEKKAHELKVPLCIPDISLKEHSGVTFRSLAPMCLVDKVQKIVPITLERINGQIVGLTGRHGGGKTVAGKTVLESVYLALSGLPVFAEYFSTDIKSVLGAVTNDEGDGSTATVFVDKVTNLMEEISKVPVHESLVFIDEIGKGTQQVSGMELGREILRTLSMDGNSVLFNTQILELAEYVENYLNGVCYKVDKDHNFVKGIAGGDIMELAKERGLLKYLKN